MNTGTKVINDDDRSGNSLQISTGSWLYLTDTRNWFHQSLIRIRRSSEKLNFINPIGLYNILQPIPQDSKNFEKIWESCLTKSIISCIFGYGLGIVFGIITSGMDPAISGTIPGIEYPKTTRELFNNIRSRSSSYGKNFAFIGGSFVALECLLESKRGTSDLTNSVIAGGITGGVIGFRGGVKAGILGTLTFSLFSTLIDYYLRFS